MQHARQRDIVGERVCGDLGAPSTLRRALPMTFMFQPARGFSIASKSADTRCSGKGA